MGEFPPKTVIRLFCRSRRTVISFVLLLVAFTALGDNPITPPTMYPPYWLGGPTQGAVNLGNCTNTNAYYVLQMSTNLIDWTSVGTNTGSPTNMIALVPTTNQLCFYRMLASPVPSPIAQSFQYALVSRSNVFIRGNAVTIDSFDSTNPLYSTAGLYDITKRKANGNVATDSKLQATIGAQSYHIYGHLITGYGTAQTNVAINSTNCAIGDLAWNASTNGIEPGYWTNNFLVSFPDVPAPAASTSLPAASNGVINLTSGAYLAVAAPSQQINIDGPVTLWVTTSYSPNITFNTNNPYASLVLYVGALSGSSVALSLGGHGSMNYPGFARNFQIYGLPSLTSVLFQGNASFVGTIYAPEATVSAGVGGNNTQDTSGAIIANIINANGDWNFHYDESLGQLPFPTFH